MEAWDQPDPQVMNLLPQCRWFLDKSHWALQGFGGLQSISLIMLLSIGWPVYFVPPSLALVTDTVPKVFPHAASPPLPISSAEGPWPRLQREREKTI